MTVEDPKWLATAETNELLTELGNVVGQLNDKYNPVETLEQKARMLRAELGRRNQCLNDMYYPYLHRNNRSKKLDKTVFWELSVRPMLVSASVDPRQAYEAMKLQLDQTWRENDSNRMVFELINWSEKIAVSHGGKPSSSYHKALTNRNLGEEN